MADYTNLAALIERYGEGELLQLAPPIAEGEEYDTARVAGACHDASGEIDGYVSGGGYPVPLDPVPRVIAAFAADIARYRLYDAHAPEQIEHRYRDAVRFLSAVASGAVRLGAAPLPSPAGAGEVQFNPGRQVFGGGGF